MKTHHPIGRWILLEREGQAELQRLYNSAGEHKPVANWVWLIDQFDFQESCQRASQFQTWRSRVRRVLLWTAEKLTERG